MATTAVKSTYGNNKASVKKDTGAAGESTTNTTHYAYRLIRDADGAVQEKEYVNNMQIFENEGKFGTYLKIRVTGSIPQDDIFVQRRRAK